MPDDDLERPPSLWPWIIGILVGLIVLGMVLGTIIHALFKVMLYAAIIALVVWGVMRLVNGAKRR